MPRGVNTQDEGRIQGRNVVNANSSNIVAPGIVTDGLVLHLDAGNYESYPIAGTSWYDLSGYRNNGTLINGPTYSRDGGGSIVFDGVNDQAHCTGSITLSEATFLAWIKRNGTQVAWAGIIFSRSLTGLGGINYRGDTLQLGYTWTDSGLYYDWASGLTPPDQSWCMVAVSINPSAAVAYLCQSSGTTSATNSISHPQVTIDDIKISVDESSSRVAKQSVAVASIYNRALTPTEVAQNFNATRSRFNI